jgi:hypothetical protein
MQRYHRSTQKSIMSTLFSRRVSYLPLGHAWTDNGEHKRHNTYPLAHSSRKKDRRSGSDIAADTTQF